MFNHPFSFHHLSPKSKFRNPTFPFLSGRRGSNSRPIAWKAIALPTELLPQKYWLTELLAYWFCNQTTDNSINQFMWGKKDSNLRSRSNGFTVRPIWPLWYSPSCYSGLTMFKVEAKHRISEKTEPPIGIEPMTYWLQVSRSTSWAKEAYKIHLFIIFCAITGHRIFNG